METILRKPASRYRVLRLRRRLQVWAMTRSFKAAAALARDIGGATGRRSGRVQGLCDTQALAKPTRRRCAIRTQEYAPYIWCMLPGSDTLCHPSCTFPQRQASH